MLESAFQTEEMRRHSFPWGSAKWLASGCVLAGLLLSVAIVVWQAGDAAKGVLILGVVVMLVTAVWRQFRQSVRLWQVQFGRDVEYVARRVREHEAELRFEGP